MSTTFKSLTAAFALTLALGGGLTITSAFVLDAPATARDAGGGGGGGGGGAGGSDGRNPSVAFSQEFPEDPPPVIIIPRPPRPPVIRARITRQLRANCFQIGATFDSRTGACQFHR